MKRLSYFEAVALLVGMVVGAGYLGIPYVVSRIGLPLGILMIVGVGLLVLLQFLLVVEVSLRTNAKHQLAGYIAKYLGRKWRKIVYGIIILEFFGALLAYIVGEGQVLSAIFGGPPLLFSLGFTAVMAILVFYGLKMVEKVDLLLTLLVAFVVIVIVFFSGGSAKAENLWTNPNPAGLLPAYGVILFSFLGAAALPEMRLVLVGKEKRFARIVVIATLIPIAIYVLFTSAVLGVTGRETTPVATVGLGATLGSVVAILGNSLAALTMATAFLGGALALRETFRFDLHLRKAWAWALTVFIPPLILVLGLNDFIEILLIVGALFGGVQGVILVITAWRAATRGDRKPEFILPHKVLIGYLLITVFAVGIVYSVLDIFNYF